MTPKSVALDSLDGQEIRYQQFEEAGESAATLVLLHANPGSPRDFDAVLPELRRKFRVVAVSWPGYGESPLEDPAKMCVEYAYRCLVGFLAATRQPPALFLGNSMGGNVAARLAAEHPDLVRGLVLVAPGGFTPLNFVTRTFCSFMASSWAPSPYHFGLVYSRHRAEPAVQAYLARYRQEYAKPKISAAIRSVWRSFGQDFNDLREVTKAVKQPTLLVLGKYDPIISPSSDGKSARATLSGAEYAELATGHLSFAEQPKEFLAAVLPFLERVGA